MNAEFAKQTNNTRTYRYRNKFYLYNVINTELSLIRSATMLWRTQRACLINQRVDIETVRWTQLHEKLFGHIITITICNYLLKKNILNNARFFAFKNV